MKNDLACGQVVLVADAARIVGGELRRGPDVAASLAVQPGAEARPGKQAGRDPGHTNQRGACGARALGQRHQQLGASPWVGKNRLQLEASDKLINRRYQGRQQGRANFCQCSAMRRIDLGLG